MTATGNRVYLVGSGPGDPGLLTLRGSECLGHADVVIYDHLVSEGVLALAAPTAKLVFVGKKGFCEHVTQDEINACILAEAAEGQGRCIVRLKGGDPFVFGRGGEEALALQAAGIPFEVVPGITAGVAAPAYAGIPVTHRTITSSVTLITGHETPGKDSSAIDWEHLAAGSGTLCFYMGIRDLPSIAQQLMRFGRSSETPVALVRWGTTPQQETLVATLGTVVQRVQEAGFKAPAIIVVGQVVALRERLAWFEDRPLFGRTVLVTRSREQASSLSEQLRDLGAGVLEFPAIECLPHPSCEGMQEAVGKLTGSEGMTPYDWVVFTSANGVYAFFGQLADRGLDARALGGVKVAAIGPGTAAALHSRGIDADLLPERFVAESVAEALCVQGVGRGSQVLLPRAAVARDALPQILRAAGAHVDVLSVYDTVVPEGRAQTEAVVEALRDLRVDAITFTSSSTVTNFITRLETLVSPDECRRLLRSTKLISIGPITSETLESAGLPADAQAEIYTIPGLLAALQAALGRKGTKI